MDEVGALRCHGCDLIQPAAPGTLSCPACGCGLLLASPGDDGEIPDGEAVSGEVGIWAYAARLPRVRRDARISLGEGRTPLLPSSDVSDLDVLVKYEGVGPTQSYKDRFNAVNVSVAKHWGRPGVALKSTGNAGLAAAAYCATAGLQAQVVCTPDVPETILRGMQDFGAAVRIEPVERQLGLLADLVADGYFPGSRSVPAEWVTPYGAEGYKTIAFELVEELGDTIDAITLPVGGGDGLYGVYCGLVELVASGALSRMPRLFAGRTRWVGASSIAYDVMGGHALDAIQATGGASVWVDQAQIEAAIAELERSGISSERASAVALAAVRAPSFPLRGGRVVAVVTGSGTKWKATAP